MSSLARRAYNNGRFLKNYAVVYSAVRNHWYKDYKPSPVPLTEEQRKLAAEKYGLHPREYDVFPDDGTGYGDYPKFPPVSAEAKDPHYPWDFPEHKRNFGEVLHVDADMISEDRYNVNAKLRYPVWVQLAQFVGVMSFFFSVYYVCDKVKFFSGRIPKQYPGEGRVHYTFEPNDSGN